MRECRWCSTGAHDRCLRVRCGCDFPVHRRAAGPLPSPRKPSQPRVKPGPKRLIGAETGRQRPTRPAVVASVAAVIGGDDGDRWAAATDRFLRLNDWSPMALHLVDRLFLSDQPAAA